ALDEVARRLAESGSGGIEGGEPAGSPPRVAVVGRPNVGKSSLVNRLLGRERQIVSDQPGTTRDAVDVLWQAGDHSFVLVDTAGLRRPGRVGKGAERLAVRHAERALERADVALLVVDASVGLTRQDRVIAGLVGESGRAAAILCNKWDIAPEPWRDVGLWRREVAESLPRLAHLPVVAVSAERGTGLGRLPALILDLLRAADLRLTTGELNRFLAGAQAETPPAGRGGRPLRIYYGTQTGVRPPTFLVFVNDPERVTPSYARYLENRLREAYPLAGTPVRLVFRARPRRRAGS
ncbi:MAG: 50S ribosome-binding GTPase, partial [Clostridia bacterium]|nr:50S ribosome-binding GTPase [Clostridia bacterium]